VGGSVSLLAGREAEAIHCPFSGGKISNVLKQVELNIFGNEECKRSEEVPGGEELLGEELICAGDLDNPADSCGVSESSTDDTRRESARRGWLRRGTREDR
jgi:hypothetical protein